MIFSSLFLKLIVTLSVVATNRLVWALRDSNQALESETGRRFCRSACFGRLLSKLTDEACRISMVAGTAPEV